MTKPMLRPIISLIISLIVCSFFSMLGNGRAWDLKSTFLEIMLKPRQSADFIEGVGVGGIVFFLGYYMYLILWQGMGKQLRAPDSTAGVSDHQSLGSKPCLNTRTLP